MLTFLTGILEAKQFNPNRAVLNCAGFGVSLFISQRSYLACEVGNETKFHTSLQINPEIIKIYGFNEEWERDLCDLLSEVKGIGYKTALAVVDGLSPTQILDAVAKDSPADLTKAPGIGKKTAERIIFELKAKLSEIERLASASQRRNFNVNEVGKFAEAENILRSLGYSQFEIDKAIKANSDTEDLLKACLVWLSGQKC